jgi:hypothetical protein
MPDNFEEQLKNIGNILMRNRIQHNNLQPNNIVISKNNTILLITGFHKSSLQQRSKDVVNDIPTLIENIKIEKKNEEQRLKAQERLSRVVTKQQAIENRNKQTQIPQKNPPRDKLTILQDRYNKYKKQTGRVRGDKKNNNAADENAFDTPDSPIEESQPPEILHIKDPENTPSAKELSNTFDTNNTTNKVSVIKSQNNFKNLDRTNHMEFESLKNVIKVDVTESKFVEEAQVLSSQIIEETQVSSSSQSVEVEPHKSDNTQIIIVEEQEEKCGGIREEDKYSIEERSQQSIEERSQQSIEEEERSQQQSVPEKLQRPRPLRKRAPQKKIKDDNLFGNLMDRYK